MPRKIGSQADPFCLESYINLQSSANRSSIWIWAAPLGNLAISYGLVAIVQADIQGLFKN